jgi:cysteine desulfurase/selenocysteine lyase
MNERIRTLFPGTRERVYLDCSARSLIPDPVREAAERHLRDEQMGTGDKDEARAAVEQTRALFARLIGADAAEIAITKNVSEGLNLFGSSLPWQQGDNVVVCPDLEHPNNVYLWYNLRRLRGIEVRQVEPVDGRISPVAMATAMDRRTRLVTFPSITFAPGFITEVEPIVAAARRVGALTLMDAAQSIGALQTDVRALGVDALVVATQKALLSLYGFGFLYVRRELADSLIPCAIARFGIDLGEGAHETALSSELTYQPGARRFDIGNYNYLGAAAARAALAFIDSIGMDVIESHVRTLAARLARGLIALGLPVAGGPPGPHLAHVVAVGTSGGGRHDTADEPRMNELHQHLEAAGVMHSIRRGVLRFSVGIYNNETDIDRTIELARDWVAQTAFGR